MSLRGLVGISIDVLISQKSVSRGAYLSLDVFILVRPDNGLFMAIPPTLDKVHDRDHASIANPLNLVRG
jgi:hypothetical protein